MSEEQSICKFNQTGFCKFGKHCEKQHEDKICENSGKCTIKSCKERHPKVCRYFLKHDGCRYKEECAYLHKSKIINQVNLNEQVTIIVYKHEKEITALREEVNRLNIIINTIAAGLLKEARNTESIDESETCKSAECDEAEDYPKPGFSCVECDYRCEKQITLKKHFNTKHQGEN